MKVDRNDQQQEVEEQFAYLPLIVPLNMMLPWQQDQTLSSVVKFLKILLTIDEEVLLAN